MPWFWLILLTLSLIANVLAVRSSHARWDELGVDLTRSVWGILAAAYLVMIVVCVLGIAWFLIHRQVPVFFRVFETDRRHWRLLGGAIFLLVLFLIPYTKFTFRVGSDRNPYMDAALLRTIYYWLSWYALLLAMAAMKLALNTTWEAGFVTALVLLGVTYEILLRFNAVTTYPLSMGWSEGSRYYYASLYFSRWIYGEEVPLSTLHPSRYLLQSVPFLIPESSIAGHRFWQFLLWIGLTAGATITLSQRAFSPRERWAKWLFAGWAFLFFLRVGVYYHLQVMVILPLLFVMPRHPWRSLAAVVVASIWAGISRVNWFPVPAMIAIAIYLLETPVGSNSDSQAAPWSKLAGYLAWPAAWAVAGLLSALGAQTAYIFLSGNGSNMDAFASSFTSDLLWYRLWPNPNHFLGVLPAILLVSGPLIVVVFLAARQWRSLHPVRWLGLFLMMLILFAGSLVVSVKIGGGGDLHNMDAYAILICITAAYFIGGSARSEPDEPILETRPWPTFALAALIPILFLIPLLSPYPRYDATRNEAAYGQLVQAAGEAGKGGPVLFINERQLVTFGDVEVPLVSDYEAVTLMEMAMANNRSYLERFYNDLTQHRFAAIVAAKQNLTIKDSGPLAEENNVWNSRVSPYILCYYQPLTTIEPQGNRIEVYVPASEPGSCP